MLHVPPQPNFQSIAKCLMGFLHPLGPFLQDLLAYYVEMDIDHSTHYTDFLDEIAGEQTEMQMRWERVA